MMEFSVSIFCIVLFSNIPLMKNQYNPNNTDIPVSTTWSADVLGCSHSDPGQFLLPQDPGTTYSILDYSSFTIQTFTLTL